MSIEANDQLSNLHRLYEKVHIGSKPQIESQFGALHREISQDKSGHSASSTSQKLDEIH